LILDHSYLELATHDKVRDRKRVPDRLGVRDDDVELGRIAPANAGRGRDVHPASPISLATSAGAPGCSVPTSCWPPAE
jgi:hypothetical protein